MYKNFWSSGINRIVDTGHTNFFRYCANSSESPCTISTNYSIKHIPHRFKAIFFWCSIFWGDIVEDEFVSKKSLLCCSKNLDASQSIALLEGINRSPPDLDGVLGLLPLGVKSSLLGDLLGVFLLLGVRPKDSLFNFFITTSEKLDVVAGLLLPRRNETNNCYLKLLLRVLRVLDI